MGALFPYRFSAPACGCMPKTGTKRIVFVVLVALVLPFFVSATEVGIATHTSSITLDSPVPAGSVIKLPSILISNTGDVKVKIAMSHEPRVGEREVPQKWISFAPENWTAQAGAFREVQAKLKVPLGAEGGDYFAFLIATPQQKGESLRIAVGVKLRFEVVESNAVVASVYRARSVIAENTLLLRVVLAVLVGVVSIVFVHRFFEFSVSKRKRKVEFY